MYSRPSPNETQEDLLYKHAEFMKQKSEKKVSLAVSQLVKDNQNQAANNEKENSEHPNMSEIEDLLANTFEAIPHNGKIGKILARTDQSSDVPRLNFREKMGFPKAQRRDVSITSGSKRQSMFALQTKKFKLDQGEKMEVDENPPEEDVKEKEVVPKKSYYQKGLVSDDDIHDANVKKIEAMTDEEVIEAREKLIATMDPAIIAFLKSQNKKRMQKEKTEGNSNPTIKEQNESAKDIDVGEIEASREVLSGENAEKWLNFDVAETSKLAWMKDVDIPTLSKSKEFEARFDFEGWLLPYSEKEVTLKSMVLYHHGEEAGRPGYTLQELFQLSRSTVIQQKIIALNTISNILSLQSTGVYDGLEIPTEQIFFVIRHCLDDNIPAVLNACIKTMKNLISSKIDETCLDSLLGFGLGQIQPNLAIEGDDHEQINDQQLVENDLIKCLARTDILIRIRYIINVMKPSVETVIHCLDILVRLARDSQSIIDKMFQCDGLTSGIVKGFMPKNLNEGEPLSQAVKLMRILACRSREIASKLINKYSVLDSIMTYLSSESFSQNVLGLKLQTECMYLWTCFANYGLGSDSFSGFSTVLVNLLRYHLKETDLVMTMTFVRNGHAAALINLICAYGVRNGQLLGDFLDVLRQCIRKWTCQFAALNEFSCGKLQLIASVVNCISCFGNSEEHGIVLDLINSTGFSTVTKTIKNGSMLLNDFETRKHSPNMKTVEAAAWHASEHVIPIIQSNSSIPFLSALSVLIQRTTNKPLQLAFLHHKNIADYIVSLRQAKRYYLTSNWFTQIEATLVMNILKTSIVVQDSLDTSIYFELAVKSLSVFNSELKPDIEYVLINVVFSPEFYPSDVRLQQLSISAESLATSFNNLNEILTVYIQVLGLRLNIPDHVDNQVLDVSIGSVIPIDWIYTPIIVLYSNQQENKKDVDEVLQVFTIKNCLKWILIYETYFPNLAARIDPTDRFCRIACVFLGSDSLFLIDEIYNLLRLCLTNVISNFEDDINFNRKVQGLMDFQKFYVQLLEQYQAVSYGDVLFGNFILVPLAQRHKTLWRKILWSEYLGVVQIFNVTPEQCICSVNSFLKPDEDDISLLKCYRKALTTNSIRKHSVFYMIAKHHVEKFIQKKQSDSK